MLRTIQNLAVIQNVDPKRLHSRTHTALCVCFIGDPSVRQFIIGDPVVQQCIIGDPSAQMGPRCYIAAQMGPQSRLCFTNGSSMTHWGTLLHKWVHDDILLRREVCAASQYIVTNALSLTHEQANAMTAERECIMWLKSNAITRTKHVLVRQAQHGTTEHTTET
jgi:hypothetical protein